MISHIVLLRLQEGLSPEGVDAFLATARDMLEPIPGVANLRAGRAIRDDSTHPVALTMEFADEATLRAYSAHAEHRRFVDEVVAPIVDDKIVLDYES